MVGLDVSDVASGIGDNSSLVPVVVVTVATEFETKDVTGVSIVSFLLVSEVIEIGVSVNTVGKGNFAGAEGEVVLTGNQESRIKLVPEKKLFVIGSSD